MIQRRARRPLARVSRRKPWRLRLRTEARALDAEHASNRSATASAFSTVREYCTGAFEKTNLRPGSLRNVPRR